MVCVKSAAVSVLVVACMVGCGGSSAPQEELVPLKGNVRVAGQPTAGIRVLFTPTGATTGTGAVGMTDAEGNYTAMHRTQKPGIVKGEYNVLFSRFLLPDGSPVPPGQSPTISGGRESVPAMWSDPAKVGTHNTITVTGDGKAADFALPKPVTHKR